MEYLVGNPIDEITFQLVLVAVVNGGIYIVGVPHEVLVPGKFITNEGSVGAGRKLIVYLLDFLASNRYTTNLPRNLLVLR